MNRKDLPALTLVGPTSENQVQEPLVVQHLDNRIISSKYNDFETVLNLSKPAKPLETCLAVFVSCAFVFVSCARGK